MKLSIKITALIIIYLTPFAIYSLEDFNVTLQPEWTNLDYNDNAIEEFGGKWMLAGSITFKKKIKDPIQVKQIIMRWTGETIDNLVASLYKKDLDKEFAPIEKNLICDGIWNKKKQSLIFNFEEKETLGPVTIFYLVLTVPESLEPLLKTGSFCIDEQCLPAPFKEYAQNNILSLATGNKQQKETIKNKTMHS